MMPAIIARHRDFAQMAAPEASGLLRDPRSVSTAVELISVRRSVNRAKPTPPCQSRRQRDIPDAVIDCA